MKYTSEYFKLNTESNTKFLKLKQQYLWTFLTLYGIFVLRLPHQFCCFVEKRILKITKPKVPLQGNARR
jgi:hypothetical protein